MAGAGQLRRLRQKAPAAEIKAPGGRAPEPLAVPAQNRRYGHELSEACRTVTSAQSGPN